MKWWIGLGSILGVVMGVSGCASTEFRYHTLIGSESGGVVTSTVLRVRLVSVQVPAEIDTAQLMVRSGESTVVMEPNDRWAAPLSDEIRGSLDDAWRRNHGIDDVEGNGAASESVPRIGVEIQKMDSVVGEHVLVVAHWWVSVGEGNGMQKTSCQSVLVEKANDGVDGLVEADQRLFKALAGNIAMTLPHASQRGTQSCPK